MSKTITYKPSETYRILKNVIESNDKIIAKGKTPVSVSIIGVHGIGKTTMCQELATDMGRGHFKLNLAQLTEPSELIGFYSKEYQVTKGEESHWITENMIPKYSEKGFDYNGETRTAPCPPDWVQKLQENDILILDDFSRGNSLFSQAVMELVNSGEMIGWNLKEKKVQIILSENPDDGNYNTSSLDAAQSDRMMKINMVWDAKDWAERAEKIGMDEKLINFVLWAPELLENKKSEGISASGNVSPRMMDKFFSLVATVDDWEKNLDLISLYGDISVGSHITNQLINFVNKNLHKLPLVEDIIKNYDLSTAKSQLTIACGDCEKDPTNWRAATAAILTTRLYNYIKYNYKTMSKDNVKQYLEVMLHPSFSNDQKYLLVKNSIGVSNTISMVIAGDPRTIKYMTM